MTQRSFDFLEAGEYRTILKQKLGASCRATDINYRLSSVLFFAYGVDESSACKPESVWLHSRLSRMEEEVLSVTSRSIVKIPVLNIIY